MSTDLDQLLQTHSWIGGDNLSLADIAYAPYITRLEHLQLHSLWEQRPQFTDWYQRLTASEGYQQGLVQWFNNDFVALMREMGSKSLPRVTQILS